MKVTQNTYIYIFQKGFNYSQDGPGNRLIYHLSGCNMHCPWCSNPEGLKKNEKSTPLSVESIVMEAESAKMIFIDGGGVTFTGGEVSLQKDAVLSAIKELKKRNISTCIETNASLENCEELFDEVDYMIADFKSPDPKKLKEYTGADIEIIKKNLFFRTKTNKPLLVRIPLINHFNNSENDFDRFIDFFKELRNSCSPGNINFEILTYHEFGKEKYSDIGMEYTVEDGFVREEEVKLFLKKIKEANLEILNT